MSESVWGSAEFHAQVRAWAATQVESHGARLTGALDQPHLRPWSSAIRLGTTAGPVWFKVNGAGTHHEPALLTLLADAGAGARTRGAGRRPRPGLVAVPRRRARSRSTASASGASAGTRAASSVSRAGFFGAGPVDLRPHPPGGGAEPDRAGPRPQVRLVERSGEARTVALDLGEPPPGAHLGVELRTFPTPTRT